MIDTQDWMLPEDPEFMARITPMEAVVSEAMKDPSARQALAERSARLRRARDRAQREADHG